MRPTVSALAPSAVTMKTGSRLWISSEEMSMSMLTKPSTQMARGMPGVAGVGAGLDVAGFGVRGMALASHEAALASPIASILQADTAARAP